MATTWFERFLERILGWGDAPVRTWLRNTVGGPYGIPVNPHVHLPDKVRIAKYFRATPDDAAERFSVRLLVGFGPLVLLLAGAALLVGEGGVAVVVAVFGLLLMTMGWTGLVAFWREYAEAEPKPDDAEMDAYLAAQLGDVVNHAMRRLGVEMDQIVMTSEEFDPEGASGAAPQRLAEQHEGPLTLIGMVLDGHRGRLGETDLVWRFPVYDVMVICPTWSFLGVFECRWDMRKLSRSNEEIREYHYDDVALVSMTNKSHQLDVKPLDHLDRGIRYSKVALVELQIVATAGERDRSEIVVDIDDGAPRPRAIRVVESRMQVVIPALRRLMRRKRRQPVR